MTLLDIGSFGAFSHSSQIFTVLGDILKLAGGGFLILLFALFSFIAIAVRSVYVAINRGSLMAGINSIIRLTAYGIGASVALAFMLVVTVLFSIPFAKVLLISVSLAFFTAFIARETFLFLVIKRFGKYIFYLTTLHQTSKVVYNYVKTPKSSEGDFKEEQNF